MDAATSEEEADPIEQDDLKTVLEFMSKYGDELEQRFKDGGKAYAAALRLAGEAEVAEMEAEEADPIKQLDTRDEKPVRRKRQPHDNRTFYKYRGFAIRSQIQGGYNSNPYGSFDGWLRHPETGDKIKWLSANLLKQLVLDIDRFWDNYNSAA